jgi:hypothetical protein
MFCIKRVRNPWIWAALFGASTAATASKDVRDIELRRLFEPTPAERRAETSGRIYIYEGLRETDVARAMEKEFDRVESMMFIRVKKTDKTGETLKDPETGDAVVEDDGC